MHFQAKYPYELSSQLLHGKEERTPSYRHVPLETPADSISLHPVLPMPATDGESNEYPNVCWSQSQESRALTVSVARAANCNFKDRRFRRGGVLIFILVVLNEIHTGDGVQYRYEIGWSRSDTRRVSRRDELTGRLG